jgi:hypothetical protein
LSIVNSWRSLQIVRNNHKWLLIGGLFTGLTDLGNAYIIFVLVLHPGLKLDYFCQQSWEEEWIMQAENLTCKEYGDVYNVPIIPVVSLDDCKAKDKVCHYLISLPQGLSPFSVS